MSTPARPDLQFDTIDAMVADASRLRGGYEKTGEWDLGMMLDHLAKTLAVAFMPGRVLPWPAGPIGRLLIHAMAGRGRYPSVKFPAMPVQRPTPGIAVDVAWAAFQTTADRVKALPGKSVVCPPIGRVPTADYVRLQLLHGAHHLGFLRPTGG